MNGIVIIEMKATANDIKIAERKSCWCKNVELYAFIVKVEIIQLTSALGC